MLRRKLVDIAQGFSKAKLMGRTIYFKHLTELDQIDLEDIEDNWKFEMTDIGMPTRAERLAACAEDGTWTEVQEEEFIKQQEEFQRFYDNKPKFRDVQHIDAFFDTVADMKKEMAALAELRSAAIGPCVEEDAQFEAYNQEICKASFADSEFKIPFFEDFDNVDPNTIAALHSLYYDHVSSMRIDGFKLIKKICCQHYFTAKFGLTEEPFFFFHKPLWELTHFQTYLLALGRRFIEVMRHSQDAPEDYFDEPDKLECYAVMMQQQEDQPREREPDLKAQIAKFNKTQ